MSLIDLAYVIGAVFFANAIPHLVRGITGRRFITPFANPPFRGNSSAFVNVAWSLANLVVAYMLLYRVGSFDLTSTPDIIAFGVGFGGMGLLLADYFSKNFKAD